MELGIFELIAAIVLIITCLLTIIVVAMQESRQSGLSGAVMGGGSDSYFGKNRGKSHDQRLKSITRVLVIIFFTMSLAVTVIKIFD